MTSAMLEHVNVTVSDPVKTATMLAQVFGWKTRWQGLSKNDGYTVHVGSDDSYIAVYSMGGPSDSSMASYEAKGGLNHIGIVVDDLAAIEANVVAAGFKPHNHGDYEPGRRFYFHDDDGVEFEVVSYAGAK